MKFLHLSLAELRSFAGSAITLLTVLVCLDLWDILIKNPFVASEQGLGGSTDLQKFLLYFVGLSIPTYLCANAFRRESLGGIPPWQSGFPVSLLSLYLAKLFAVFLVLVAATFIVSGAAVLDALVLRGSAGPGWEEIGMLLWSHAKSILSLPMLVTFAGAIAFLAPLHWLALVVWVVGWVVLEKSVPAARNLSPMTQESGGPVGTYAAVMGWSMLFALLGFVGFLMAFRKAHLSLAAVAAPRRWVTWVSSIAIVGLILVFVLDDDSRDRRGARRGKVIEIATEHFVFRVPYDDMFEREALFDAAEFVFSRIRDRLAVEVKEPVFVSALGSAVGTLGIARAMRIDMELSGRFEDDMRVLGHELTHTAVTALAPGLVTLKDGRVRTLVHEGTARLFESLVVEPRDDTARSVRMALLSYGQDPRGLLGALLRRDGMPRELDYDFGAEFFSSLNRKTGDEGLRRFLTAFNAQGMAQVGGERAFEAAALAAGTTLADILAEMQSGLPKGAVEATDEFLTHMTVTMEIAQNGDLEFSIVPLVPPGLLLRCNAGSATAGESEVVPYASAAVNATTQGGRCRIAQADLRAGILYGRVLVAEREQGGRFHSPWETVERR